MQHSSPSITSNFRRRSGGAVMAYSDGSSMDTRHGGTAAPTELSELSKSLRLRSRSLPGPNDRSVRQSEDFEGKPPTTASPSGAVTHDGGYHDYPTFPTAGAHLREIHALSQSNAYSESALADTDSSHSLDVLDVSHGGDSEILQHDSPRVTNENCQSPISEGTTFSMDSNHSVLHPFIKTTTKLTRRWPRPSTLQYFEGYKIVNPGSMEGAEPTLEEGQGLGLNHVSKWSTYKTWLLVSVMSVFAYGSAGLMYAIMTWFNTWHGADVMVVADFDILVVITLAASLLVFTSLVGIAGTLLNSRPILAVYALLLWPTILSTMAIGYMAYKREALSLDRKLDFAWGRSYTTQGKQMIQDSLQCCGFYSPLHDASPTKRCYTRTALPGCRNALLNFEFQNLRTVWMSTFSVAGLHIINIVVALLCSNHITNTFGKGLTPGRYRLCPEDVKSDAEIILNGISGDIRLQEKSAGERSIIYWAQ